MPMITNPSSFLQGFFVPFTITSFVTCSHHLIKDFEVGASCSMALMSQVSAGYPRVSRDCFMPGYGHFLPCPDTDVFFASCLCSQHPPRFFPDVDRCVFVPVHDAATVTAVYPLRQRKFLFYLSASAAFLAGRIEPVDLY